jgi:hypothetical protein
MSEFSTSGAGNAGAVLAHMSVSMIFLTLHFGNILLIIRAVLGFMSSSAFIIVTVAAVI